MIVWLASYPRSGNTFMRILLHRFYGLHTSTVYDLDGVAERLGADLVGYRQRSRSWEKMRNSNTVYFVKTHRPCDDLIDDRDGAICIVRDGRDAVVSWARQRAEQSGSTFELELQDLIDHPERRGAGSWGSNVRSWLHSPRRDRKVVHYHELIYKPVETISEALAGIDRLPRRSSGAVVPSFQDLHAIDAGFFRVGMVGTHREEMPRRLQESFLAVSDNRKAMEHLGYLE